MTRPKKILLAALAWVCLQSLVYAQGPSFQPYGAWRGRIRYVEGPHRTKQRIHWGSGITPTGGQVLMHGLTVAGDVFTNPDFLSKLAPRSPSDQTSIDNEWNAIRATDDNLLKELNELRSTAKLKPVEFPSDAVAQSITQSPAATPSADDGFTNATNAFDAAYGKVKDETAKLKVAVADYKRKVVADAPFLAKIKSAAEVSNSPLQIPSESGTVPHADSLAEWTNLQAAIAAFKTAVNRANQVYESNKSLLESRRDANGKATVIGAQKKALDAATAVLEKLSN